VCIYAMFGGVDCWTTFFESSIIISSGFYNAVQSKIEGHKWEGVSVWLGGQGV